MKRIYGSIGVLLLTVLCGTACIHEHNEDCTYVNGECQHECVYEIETFEERDPNV